LKIKLNNSCFKNQSRCWTMNETLTMTEDLFAADNSDAYDIVRNSDFMVLSRAALAAHDGVPSQAPGHGSSNLNIDFCRTLECSVPGPQVRTRPRQLDVGGTMHGYPHTRVGHVAALQQQATCRLSSPVSQQAQSHIYMEVDPLYSTFNPGQLLMQCSEPQYLEAGEAGQTGGLVSSTSSQTSSGYSSAPSDGHLQHSANMYTEFGDTEYESASQDLMTKDINNRVYSISQSCEFHQPAGVGVGHRNSQRQKKPELVMNNILLQQTNREVL